MSTLPESIDYRAEIATMIRKTYQTIEEALGYIERQEDGPLTMRFALRDIEHTVEAIETEVCYLTGALEQLQTAIATLQTQRDEAMQQRNLLMGSSSDNDDDEQD